MRITQAMFTRSVLGNIHRGAARLRRLQEMIATGKQVLRPSDDPGAARSILAERARLGAIDAYRATIAHSQAALGTMEGALATAEDIVQRAREIVLQAQNDTMDQPAREALADEVDALRGSLLLVGNASLEGVYLLGGEDSTSAPFVENGSVVEYRGNDRAREAAPLDSQRVEVTLSGRRALGVRPAEIASRVDLNPVLDPLTPLTELRRGAGLTPTAVEVTDSNGTVAVVDLSSARTVGDLLALFNAAPVSITASLAADGTGIQVEDTGSGTTLTIAESGGGITASQLGLLGTSDTGLLQGADLDPALSPWNPLALLAGGSGIPPGVIHVENGTSSDLRTADLDFSGIVTVGDFIYRLEHATTTDGRSLGLKVDLSAETGTLTVRSTLPFGTLEVRDVPGCSLAARLGLSGREDAEDLFSLLGGLADQLRAGGEDFGEEMDAALSNLDLALENVLSARSGIGVTVQRLERIGTRLDTEEVAITETLDSLESTDLAKAITDLALTETGYEAALKVGGQILPSSLFDYLS